MTGLEVALLFGLLVLLTAVIYLAHKLQKLHRRARHLKHLVQKLEGIKEERAFYDDKDELGGG